MKNWLSRYAFWHETVLALMLIGLMTWLGWTEPAGNNSFVSWQTQSALLDNIWELALIALPMTLIIITAGIDLSVGSIMALSAVVLGISFRFGLSAWLGALLAWVTACLAGAFNGGIIAKTRVHPLIVTLATLAAFKGLAEGISHGESVSRFPDSFRGLSEYRIWSLPIAGWLFLAASLAVGITLIKTPWGRYLYAIGYNETACRYSGVPVDRIRFALHTLSGAVAGLAAIIYVSRRDSAKADIGEGMELDVITAVVLGGTSIFGGRGNIWGTLLGVLLVHETRELVSWRWNQSEWYLIAIGMLLIGSVLLNRLLTSSVRKRDRV